MYQFNSTVAAVFQTAEQGSSATTNGAEKRFFGPSKSATCLGSKGSCF